MQRKRLPLIHLLFLVTCVLLIVLALLPRFNGFRILDDAYMFVRYADNLLATGTMSWQPGGEAVYGATSVLYVIFLLPFRLLAPDNPALALFMSSFFWGMAFVLLLFRLALREISMPDKLKPYVAGLVLLTLAISMEALYVHFSSGMDTMFVMAYLTGFLILAHRFYKTPEGMAWLKLGLLGGLAWFVRPDLLVFVLGLPGWLLLFGGARLRSPALKALGVTAALTLACLGVAAATLHSPLPMSFFAKGTGLYGEGFASHYTYVSIWELSRFIARQWPLVLLIGMGVFLKWGRLRRAYSALDVGIVVAIVFFLIYYTFFVLQVMGFGQRFYYPLLPFLVYLAVRELVAGEENLFQSGGLRLKDLPYAVERLSVVFLGGVLLVYGVRYGARLKNSNAGKQLAVFQVEKTYRAELKDYWFKLDRFSALPDDLVIATTEVGMPAAMNPGKTVIDMAGLNEPKLIENGLSCDYILERWQPDLIYLPHPHYENLVKSFEQSERLAREYVVYPDTTLKVAMGVAVRQHGKHSRALGAIFREVAPPSAKILQQ